MKWIRHDTDANQDARLQNVLLDYGLEGYGLYWYCIELVAGKIDIDNLTFELEHDARILARNTGSTPQKVEEMMRYFVKLGLFEDSAGVITCLKIARRLNKSMTSNPQMRDLIDKIKSHDGVMIESRRVMQDKTRSDQTKLEYKDKDLLSENSDAAIVLQCMNELLGAKYKSSTKSHIENISARLSDGHSIDDLKLVIAHKKQEWGSNPKMAQYLRPSTLFQAGKFQGYLMAAKTAPKSSLHNLANIQYTEGEL